MPQDKPIGCTTPTPGQGGERGADPDHPPRRQPRRDRTRIALVRAGQKLFSDRPVEMVSVDDVVQAADVAKGTFYNHFADKEAFERELVADARGEMETAIVAAFGTEQDPAVRMALAMCVSVRFAHDHRDRARLIVRQFIANSTLQSEVNRTMLQDVSAGIISGRFSVPTTEIGGLAVLGLGNIGIVRALELDDIYAKVMLGQQLAFVLLQSLGVAAHEASQLGAKAAERTIRVASPAGAAAADARIPQRKKNRPEKK